MSDSAFVREEDNGEEFPGSHCMSENGMIKEPLTVDRSTGDYERVSKFDSGTNCGFDPSIGSRDSDFDSHIAVEPRRTQRTAWAEPHIINPDDFLVDQSSVIAERKSEIESRPYQHSLYDDEPMVATSNHQGETYTQVASERRKNSPRQKEEYAPVSMEAAKESSKELRLSTPRRSPREKPVALVIPTEDSRKLSTGGKSMSVGDDLDVGATVRISLSLVYFVYWLLIDRSINRIGVPS